jgi:hypothetical protein
MDARLIGPDDSRWRDALRGISPDFYHQPGFAAVSARHEGGEAVALHSTSGGRTTLVPLILRPTPDGARDATSPQGYPGALVRPTQDPESLAEALLAGVDLLRARRVVSLYVRLHPLMNADPPDGVGEIVRHPDTVLIDLSLSYEVLWRQTRQRFRTQINSAIRAGHVIRVDSDDRSLAAFKDLYRSTLQRRSASPAFDYSDEYFEGLRDVLGPAFQIAVVEVHGEPAAAGLYIESGGIVHLHLAGSDRRFDHAHPTKLMYHRMREWAKSRGNRWMLLGGGRGTSDDTLLHFKAGFSRLRAPYRTLRVAVTPRRYRSLVARRFPEGVPSWASDFFPVYRCPSTTNQDDGTGSTQDGRVGWRARARDPSVSRCSARRVRVRP